MTNDTEIDWHERCAAAYQMFATLANHAGLFHHPDVQRGLDWLNGDPVPDHILPWPTTPLGAPYSPIESIGDVYDAWAEILRFNILVEALNEEELKRHLTPSHEEPPKKPLWLQKLLTWLNLRNK